MKLNIHLYIYARNENRRPYQDLGWTFTAALFRIKLEKKKTQENEEKPNVYTRWMDG